jgi:hypothetical protein
VEAFIRTFHEFRKALFTVAGMQLVVPGAAAAQGGAPSVHLGAQAIGVYTHQEPIPGGGSLAEARLVQPVALLEAGAGRFAFIATVDFEGLTIPNGELTIGVAGEGFMDRRHPHTYAHELILMAHDLLGRPDGPAALSAAIGKGFVPFGSDDPMSRPVERYPVNHHLAQILERALVAAGARVGPARLEAALFNGDEPTKPTDWPILDHVGDSWATRLTLVPLAGVEWQGSLAHLHSPEHRGGAGPDQNKWSTSARVDRPWAHRRVYGLAELARTSEANGFFVFHSALVEGALTERRSSLYARMERTERPEEERTLDGFRAVRPHIENATLGTSRWTILTAGYQYNLAPAAHHALRLAPFFELSRATVAKVDGGLFDPASFYGRTSFWTVSVGVGMYWRMAGHRMGRYFDDRSAGHAMAGMRDSM